MCIHACTIVEDIIISSTIVYLQRLEEDKRTLEQEAVLVKNELQAKDERLETLEVHYTNLIQYNK